MNKKNNNEQNLIERLKQGDDTAMDEIFRTYYHRLYYFAVRAIGQSMDAEDMVQEAFIGFWVMFQEKGDFQGSIQAYLYQSVRNRCLRHLQKQQTLSGRNGEIIERFYLEAENRLDELALKQELYHRASETFSRLTPAQRAVMKLLFQEGLSVSEAAAEMQTTENNIRNHKARAVERLKTILQTVTLPIIIFFLIFLTFTVMKYTARVL